MRRAFVAAFLCAALAATAGVALPPAPTRWVTDEAGFLSPATRSALDARLATLEQHTGHQLLVYIDRSTRGEPIDDFAARAFAAWRVGRKGLDDGLVLFVMADDRAMRIEVGYGLESVVPDAIASRVIRDVLVPGFRSGDRDGAVTRAVDALAALVQGGSLPGGPLGTRLPVGQLVGFGVLAVLFGILFITNPSLALSLLFVLASGRRRGGGFGRASGGGFRGGGGRSGGGGASGSW